MNSEYMNKVANSIENENTFSFIDREGWKITLHSSFGMETWGDLRSSDADRETKVVACGTSACVAGWACLINNPAAFYERLQGLYWFATEDPAQRLLGLTKDEAHHLFYGGNVGMHQINEVREYVPDALRWMALNDTVDWYRALSAVGASVDYKTPDPREEEDYDDFEDEMD